MTNSHLRDDDREKLGAFLDGELDSRTAASVRAEIEAQPAFRDELEALRGVWTLLDHLPRPGASPDFAQRTLAMAHRPETRRSGQWRKLIVGGSWAAIIVVAAVIGFEAMRTSSPQVPQAGDDRYAIETPRDDIDFLHKLADPNDHDLFGEDGAGS